MDTKLKNNRKMGWILVICILLICAIGMVLSYSLIGTEIQDLLKGKQENIEMLSDISEPLNEGNYILYNEISGETDRVDVQEEYGGDEFFLLRKYLDYEVFSWEGEALLNSADDAVQRKLVQKNSEYALRVKYLFAADGELDDVQVDGTVPNELTQYELERTLLDRYRSQDYWQNLSIPGEVMMIYGITQDNMDAYWSNYNYGSYLRHINALNLADGSVYQGVEFTFFLIVILAALLIPHYKKWGMGEQKIFQVPLEIVLCVIGVVIGLNTLYAQVVWSTLDRSLANSLTVLGLNEESAYFMSKELNVLMWFLIFAVMYWSVTCLRAMFVMKKAYFIERSWLVRGCLWGIERRKQYERKMKIGAGGLMQRLRKYGNMCKDFCVKTYEGLLHLNFQDQMNRTILKIVILNFIAFSVISFFWYYKSVALIIYSVVLFLFLRKYFADLQGQYRTLLKDTGMLANGNLDILLESDYGVFNPVGEELARIQSGLKKAVEEEVKSERMKTELVTNVSHDLKTPLTAIITYIDLLKQEKNEEKQQEYIEVLERKSLRLKVLIEDLFEISKASSRNVTMNFMKVDIVGLLKQVGLEYDGKIKEANLDFKWRLPEEKLILWLDSQKTYRIFENLIVNITKYAMPHTRVYVEMKQMNDKVHIMMKNVSAAELNFNTEEITDRFVRGDVSRNTEGSGLGLAIAKSFTELQGGDLKVSTDADLFKVEIVFPCMKGDMNGGEVEG
ncbi:MAG: HAMP domain-containing histidine kinase [Hespellia sp.]|nr:HAMP domain-containing histidine kinase [Hespellia sp.]